MSEIFRVIDTLIKDTKRKLKENITFVKAYSDNIANTCSDKLIAVVNMGEIKKLQEFIGGYFDEAVKGDMFSLDLFIRVYSRRNGTGEDLGKATIDIYESLKEADNSKIIESSSVGPINYDENVGAIYRQINCKLDFCLCGEK
ncbi:MAG: hypothetical protein ACI4Q8_03565 [Ruminococcus sp.]